MNKSELVVGKTYHIKDPSILYEGYAKLIEVFHDECRLSTRFTLTSGRTCPFPLSAIIREVVPTRIVICANDYPYAILPEGATEEQARIKCAALQLADVRNSDDDVQVVYHWHVVSETTVDTK